MENWKDNWHWNGEGIRWKIAKTYSENEVLPDVRDTVTVYRKDGSSSEETIVDVFLYCFDNPRVGQDMIYCYVESSYKKGRGGRRNSKV